MNLVIRNTLDPFLTVQNLVNIRLSGESDEFGDSGEYGNSGESGIT